MSLVGLLIPGQSPVRGHRSVPEARAGLVEARPYLEVLTMLDIDNNELVLRKHTGMTAPSTRMLVVIASVKLSGRDPEKWSYQWKYYPVLALCAVTRRHYTRKEGGVPFGEAPRWRSHKDLVKLGWDLEF